MGRSAETGQRARPPGAPIVVVGAGAAGMLAAGMAARSGARVVLLESKQQPGRKLAISGKTRCNLTNTEALEAFLRAYGPNGKFLRGPFSRFFRDDLLGLLAELGVPTKAERGGRVFPESDSAEDVVAALERLLKRGGVEVRYGTPAQSVRVEEGRARGVLAAAGEVAAGAVILATGGASYPATGSTGDGYRMAEALGHRIVPLRPALVPLVVEEAEVTRSMQGVSLRNVRLTALRGRADSVDPGQAPGHDCGRGIPGKQPKGAVIESRMGEAMLTHFGLGGPITLLMSLAVVDALAQGPVSLVLDLKPAVPVVELRQRLQRELEQASRRTLRRIMTELLPHKMIEPVLGLAGLPGEKLGHQVSGAERDRLAGLLKGLRFNVTGPLSLAAAIVTAGGVALKEVDPRTMESRLVEGLYLCGEVLDLDADTGGYNLQAAFSTGAVAGLSAAEAADRRTS